MKEIVCTLGTLQKAIDAIEELEERINQKTKLFMERLAEVGITEARANFDTALYDGHNDVKVDSTPEWVDEETLLIKAQGQAIAFIEFGTGVWNTGWHPKAVEHGAHRGEYGQGKGQNKAWGYYGDPSQANSGTAHIVDGSKGTVIVTRGNDPNYCMYDAGQAMRREVERIAKEVFGSD